MKILGAALVAVTTGLSVACTGSARAPTSTIEIVTPAATPTVVALSGDPSVTVVNVVLACREKDAARLHALLATPVPDDQIEALFALGRDVVLKSQSSAVTDDQAAVTVDLEIVRATGSERVQRTWQLVRGADGFWRLTALPDCY